MAKAARTKPPGDKKGGTKKAPVVPMNGGGNDQGTETPPAGDPPPPGPDEDTNPETYFKDPKTAAETEKKKGPPAKKTGVNFTKATIKNDLFLYVEYTESVTDGTATVKKDCTAPVHDDLKAAFSALDEHLRDICGQFDEDGRPAPGVTARGFSIGGAGEKEGVIISGVRKLEGKKVVSLSTPFTRWTDKDYTAIDQLVEALQKCKQEVRQYVLNNKHQPDAQLSLPGMDENKKDEADASYSEEEL